MILSTYFYQIENRKGLLLFHQKCETVSSKILAQKVFDIFDLNYTDTLRDRDSTRIPSVDDMGELEIQLLENAKRRTLSSLPQNSLYWGSSLYHFHVNSENIFIKLPLWFEVQRVRNGELETLELDQSWAKLARNPQESFLIGPKNAQLSSKRLIGSHSLQSQKTFRIAQFLSKPFLNLSPLFSIDSLLRGET